MRIRRSLAALPPSLSDPARRPRWLTRGAIRLGVLCLFIVLTGMLSPRMSQHGAGLVLLGGLATVAGATAAFVIATRALLTSHPLVGLAQGRVDAGLGLLRQTGLPLLGLAFFLIWTLVYVAMWWYRPGGAFSGLAPSPRFSDFFYYAVSTGLISPPGDIIATSRGARSATLIEMLSGLALVTVYLSSFADVRPSPGPAPAPGED